MKIHSIKFNFFMNTFTTLVNFLYPLVTFPYVSRVLTPTGYGGAEFAISTAQIFALVALLGVNTYGLRECAKVRDDAAKQAKLFQELLVVISIWTVIVTISYYVFVILLLGSNSNMQLFLISGLLIPLTSFGLQWFMSANEQYAFMAVRNVLIKLAILALMFLCVHTSNDVVIWVVLSVLATGLATFANCIYAIKNIKLYSWGELKLRRHIQPLVVFFLMVASISIYTTLDSVMLGFMTDSTQVGYYSVAVKIKNVFTAIIASLANVLIPRVAYTLAHNQKNNYYRLINVSVRVAMLYSVFTVFAGMLYAEPIILLLAGDSYRNAIVVLFAIMPAVACISFTQITSLEILTPQNKEKALSITYCIAGVVDIVLNIILIPVWQALGAAIATTVAEFLVFLMQLVIIAKKEKMQPYLQNTKKLVPGLVVSVFCLGVGRALFGVSLISTICVVFFSFCGLCITLLACKEPLILRIKDELLSKLTRR